MIDIAAQKKHQYIAEKYGVPEEVIERAIADVESVRKLVNEIIELAPTAVCWGILSRAPVATLPSGAPSPSGFESLDHAIYCYLDRLAGMTAALTCNTDGLLTPHERKKRDEIVAEFLDRVVYTYLDLPRH